MKFKKGKDFFIFKEKKDNYANKIKVDDPEYQVFIALKFTNAKIDIIAN